MLPYIREGGSGKPIVADNQSERNTPSLAATPRMTSLVIWSKVKTTAKEYFVTSIPALLYVSSTLSNREIQVLWNQYACLTRAPKEVLWHHTHHFIRAGEKEYERRLPFRQREKRVRSPA